MTKILFVDDEPNVLSGYQRQFRKQYTVETAAGGAEALEKIGANEPYAVIVSDMQMPGMNGVEFLSKAATLTPHTVRIMLTGNADQHTAMEALNEGRIFRFLTKPCPLEMLTEALEAGLAQHRLIVAEKELLEKTLIGSIGILVDVLFLSDPRGFERCRKLRDCARETAGAAGYANRWELEVAALLSQIGTLMIPADVHQKVRANMPLTSAEADILARAPNSGCNLLVKIPRLETAARIIRYHQRQFDGGGALVDDVAGEELPLGSRILKILSDMIDLESEGLTRSVAFRRMHGRSGWYDPKLFEALQAYYLPPLKAPEPTHDNGVRKVNAQMMAQHGSRGLAIHFRELMVGDVLTSDLQSADGACLLHADSIITEALLEKLKSYVQFKGVKEPFFVAVSAEEPEN